MSKHSIKLYKYTLLSDIDLGYKSYNGENTINLISKKGNTIKQENIYENNNGEFQIDSPIASYTINTKNKQISVLYNSVEEIRSTLFNLPMAAYAVYEGDLLLHASSIYQNGEIVAFCGSKGKGKSTLVSLFGNQTPIFSDDTIYLTDSSSSVVGCSSFYGLKLTEETWDNCKGNTEKIFGDFPRTIQNKAFVPAKEIGLMMYEESRDDMFKPKLTSIVVLHRTTDAFPRIIPIENMIEKTSVLLENCVGTAFFSHSMLNGLITSKLFKSVVRNCRFYNLYIPDSLVWLKKNYINLLEMILEEV